MKDFFTRKKSSGSPAIEQDVVSQIGEIKKQLDCLEKKIDSLLSQPSHQGKRNRDRDFTGKNLTQATCSACNSPCEIPFKPTGNRPVYCSDCFSKRKRGNSSNNNRFAKQKKIGFEQFFNKKKSPRR